MYVESSAHSIPPPIVPGSPCRINMDCYITYAVVFYWSWQDLFVPYSPTVKSEDVFLMCSKLFIYKNKPNARNQQHAKSPVS